VARVLIVVTSHASLGGAGATGVGLQTVAAPWYVLADAGVSVAIGSPQGGTPPVDPLTFGDGVETAALARFDADPGAARIFESSLRIDQVEARELDAVFFAGGHGGMWDFPESAAIQDLVLTVLDSGGYVAAVCQGVAALCGSSARDVLAGRTVTGLTNAEEKLLERDEDVPFHLQDRLVDLGATFAEADAFTPHAVVDGQVITGQNMRSADATAHALLDSLAR
jgi:putative intracellular protease/amidase